MVKSVQGLGRKLCSPCAGGDALKQSAKKKKKTTKSVLRDDKEKMEGIFCSVLHWRWTVRASEE